MLRYSGLGLVVFIIQIYKILYYFLLTGCQVLPWNKPIKSCRNQSVQLYTKTGLEISTDFGPENMRQYVVNLG